MPQTTAHTHRNTHTVDLILPLSKHNNVFCSCFVCLDINKAETEFIQNNVRKCCLLCRLLRMQMSPSPVHPHRALICIINICRRMIHRRLQWSQQHTHTQTASPPWYLWLWCVWAPTLWCWHSAFLPHYTWGLCWISPQRANTLGKSKTWRQRSGGKKLSSYSTVNWQHSHSFFFSLSLVLLQLSQCWKISKMQSPPVLAEKNK